MFVISLYFAFTYVARPNELAAYKSVWPKYQRTELLISCSLSRKKDKKHMTMPEASVISAAEIIVVSLMSFFITYYFDKPLLAVSAVYACRHVAVVQIL